MMKYKQSRFRCTAAIALALLAAGCAESERPQPTGAAFFRGLNAMVSSPALTFSIEERGLESLGYKQVAAAQQFDDFSYTFNWDFTRAGDDDESRLASTFIDTLADQDYLIVVTGTIAAPQVLVWERPDREWDGSETVFRIDFGHAAPAIGEVDVYVGPEGTVPMQGESIASLAFGDFLPPVELEADTYVVFVTEKDDPAAILLQSDTVIFSAAQSFTGTVLDPDPNITGDLAFRLINATGAASELADINSPPQVRFLHASLDEVAVDISINGDTANPVVTALAFGEFAADVDIPTGDTSITLTEAGNPGVILLEQAVNNIPGSRNTYLINGAAGSIATTALLDDLRPRETNARLRVANMSLNQQTVDVFLVEPGTDINDDEVAPSLVNVVYPINSAVLQIVAGSYELWLTARNDKTMVFAGPVAIDFANGDTVELALLDNVDPSIVDLLEYQR